MNVKEKNNNEILLLSHELSRTGAPIVLRDLAVVSIEMGYSMLVGMENLKKIMKRMIFQ